MSEQNRAMWIALGISEGTYAVAYAMCAFVAWVIGAILSGNPMYIFGTAVAFVIFGAFAVVLAVPLAVVTAGRLTARLTANWPPMRAAFAHMAVGLVLGGAAASVVILNFGVGLPVPLAIIAFGLPGGITAFVTRLLVPRAMRRR